MEEYTFSNRGEEKHLGQTVQSKHFTVTVSGPLDFKAEDLEQSLDKYPVGFFFLH